jgi:N-acetylglutamate synthase-like GNAT family acetyltransferase
MMTKSEIAIQSASKKDILIIEHLAKEFELDLENFNWNQFVVAKKDNKIIGFGRLRKYKLENQSEECYEIATVGVVFEERKRGAGSLIVKEIIRNGPSEIFITCVIPCFFEKLGFQLVKHYPSVLQKKVDFCKSYNFNDDQIFVMKHTK